MDIIKHTPYSIKTVFHKVWFKKKKELWSGDFFFFFFLRSWENGEVGEREKVQQCCRLAHSSPRLQTENPARLIHHRRLITQELQAGDDEFQFGRPQRQLLQKLQVTKQQRNLGDFISAKLGFHEFFSPWEPPLARQKSRFPHLAELLSVIRTINTYEGGTEFAPSFCSSPRMARSVCYANS